QRNPTYGPSCRDDRRSGWKYTRRRVLDARLRNVLRGSHDPHVGGTRRIDYREPGDVAVPVLGYRRLRRPAPKDVDSVRERRNTPARGDLSEFGCHNGSRERSSTREGSPVSRPSALAQTGSKSTNHDLKSARAIASSVSFIRLFSSILSSSVPRVWAIACCSSKSGTGMTTCRSSAWRIPCAVVPVARERSS